MSEPLRAPLALELSLIEINDRAMGASTLWPRIVAGLDPPDLAFGPEWRERRPRPGERYWLAEHDAERVGLVWVRSPAPTTRVFGLGLFREHRGRGLGPPLRDATLALCFADSRVWKVETEIYSSNEASLEALHRRHGRMREEGRQRETIEVRGLRYDRLLVGLARPEWEAGQGTISSSGEDS